MYQGNWKCSSCGGAITELPFEPRSESGLTCGTCYFKQKDGESAVAASETAAAPADEQPMPDNLNYEEAADEQPPAPDFAAAPLANSGGERPAYTGEWACATCSNPITSLPFEPRNTSNLKCLDCFKASKG